MMFNSCKKGDRRMLLNVCCENIASKIRATHRINFIFHELIFFRGSRRDAGVNLADTNSLYQAGKAMEKYPQRLRMRCGGRC